MTSKSIQLTIEGKPNESITIRYRGNREDEDTTPVVFEGELGSDGRLIVEVPCAYLVILSEQGTMPLELHEEQNSHKTIDITGKRADGDRLRILEEEVASLRKRLDGQVDEINAKRITLRGPDGEVLWKITTHSGERAGHDELLFQDPDGKNIAILRRRDFGFEKYYPSIELLCDQAVAVSLGVETLGRGTEIPVLSLIRPLGDTQETIKLVAGLEGPRIEMNGNDGAFSASVNQLVMKDEEGKVRFSQPPQT